MIPFLELKPAYDELKEELDAAYHRVMESGWYLFGEELSQFEAEYAAYCESEFAIGVGNGLDALHIALRAYDIGDGDEVLVPSHTFIATWLAVTYSGAVPVPVEPDPLTYNINPTLVEAAITPRTRAIIPVHLYGQPADMRPILEIAARHDLVVIEDAAQAQGARYRGKRIGGIGHAASHSFYPGKNLGAFADGGAITTNSREIAERCRVLRNYGSKVKYEHLVAGFNSRLSELQAAFLRVRLRHLDEWNERRLKIANMYLDELSGELLASKGLSLPFVPDWAQPVWHLFVVRHENRDSLQKALLDNNVIAQTHYPVPVHKSAAYAQFNSRECPIACELSRSVLSLPIGPHLPPQSSKCVVNAISKILSERV